jgi:outer membrane lipoprotein-sorting protein
MCAALRLSMKRILAVATTAGLAFSLSGCLSLTIHKRTVDKTVVAKNLMDATLDQLNGRLAQQYAAVKTLNAKVTIKASTGGQHEGEVKEIPAFSGYILLRKPSDLRVIMELPLVGSMALDMVANGKTFKLSIPPKKIAREGSEELTTPSSKGFENLRPSVVRDALQVPPVSPDELVSETRNARILPPVKGKKEATEEPDYDLTVSRVKQGNELQTIRVIHVSRVTLKPYEQDIYDKAGNIVEIVTYDKYQKFGDIDFPMSILITMPIDEYSMQIDITKLTLNEDMDDEQFVLPFPPGTPVQKMP